MLTAIILAAFVYVILRANVALSITASEVQYVSGPVGVGIAGEAITAGETVYVKSSDNKVYLADADLSAAGATCVGIALCSVAASQQVTYAKPGSVIKIGSSASVGQGAVYCLGATAGSIVPEADLTTDDYVTILGVGNDDDGIVLNIHVSGVTHV